MSKTKKSVIDKSDRELAGRVAREAIQLALNDLDNLIYKMTGAINLLGMAYPESEMTGGKYRPTEYSAAVNLRARLTQAKKHVSKLLDK